MKGLYWYDRNLTITSLFYFLIRNVLSIKSNLYMAYRRFLFVKDSVKMMIIKATSQFPRLLLVIIISENDDHKKSQNSQLHGFLWSSYVLYKDDHKKSWRLNGGFFWSSFSKIVPPFPCNFEQKFSVWDLYSIPIYARINPRALVKKVIVIT